MRKINMGSETQTTGPVHSEQKETIEKQRADHAGPVDGCGHLNRDSL
jgi:hypothetical protein